MKRRAFTKGVSVLSAMKKEKTMKTITSILAVLGLATACSQELPYEVDRFTTKTGRPSKPTLLSTLPYALNLMDGRSMLTP